MSSSTDEIGFLHLVSSFQRLLFGFVSGLVVLGFCGAGLTVFSTTAAPQTVTDYVIFFGGVFAMMLAAFIFVRANRSIEQLVNEQPLARLAFGVDVVLVSLAISAMIGKFFLMMAGGYKWHHVLQYATLVIVAAAALSCVYIGLRVAAGVGSPAKIFSILKELNKEKSA